MLRIETLWKPAVTVPAGDYLRRVTAADGETTFAVFVNFNTFSGLEDAIAYLVTCGVTSQEAESYVRSLPIMLAQN